MRDREKLLHAVRTIRALLTEHELIGHVVLAGRDGCGENHLMLDAPWCKALLIGEGDLADIRFMISKDDRQEDVRDTASAISMLGQLTAITSLSLLEASQAVDERTGATHSPLRKDEGS